MVVVDDASPDGRVAGVARAAGARVLRLPRRGGFCVAANAGVAATTGEVVEVLNDDVEVSPGWVEAALARFADPAVGAVAPLVLKGPPGAHRPERVDSAGDEYHLAGVARKRWHGEALAPEHLAGGAVFGANGTGSFYRRRAFDEAGGFPEAFVAYFDDVDLSFRLGRAGWRVWYEPGCRMHHRVSSSYGEPSGELLALQSRNEELVFWRNVPAWKMPVALPLHLAVLAGKAARRLREGRLGPFLRGRGGALACLWRGVAPSACRGWGDGTRLASARRVC